MLRIYDGQAAALVTPGRGLQVQVSAGPGDGLDGLRRYLVADLLRRTAQSHRLAVSVNGQPGAEPGTLTALNIHPPGHDAQVTNGADVWIVGAEAGPAGTHWVAPGPARAEAADLGGVVTALTVLTDRGLDPLALRLAFLEHPYRQPLDLAWDEVGRADGTLRDWRRLVAAWAMHPSKPMCAQYVAELTEAFDDDLDTPAALGSLRRLAEDAEIPPGSKFETAAHLDQLLGLDVVSEVGRLG
jgi:hypothetical protein